ncbi:MAG: hypothetical protein JNM65_08770 [Verrucomicrobiaceae bacterium]|nr:hypothetical protein [Verrucomicrobiaceae bacterium]
MSAAMDIPLSECVAKVTSTRGFGYAVRDFLDQFRHEPDMRLITEEPPLLSSILKDEGVADAYLASVAATLAHEQGLPAPDWAKGSARSLEKPFFAAKTPKLKAVLLQESPVEFRIRNIFVSANALSRA